jgi:VWFA-related protein
LRLNSVQAHLLTTVVLGLLPGCVLAGQATAHTRGDETVGPHADCSRMVRLWVLAARKDHHIVQGLKPQDFRIYQDKVQQPITYFEPRTTEPIRLGILIDVSRGRLDEPEQVDWRPISRVLRRLLGPNDRAFVAEFGAETSLVCPWTSDFSVLDEALQRVFDSPQTGGAALYDSLFTLFEERFSGETGRKALVILCGTPDDSSSHTEEEALELVDGTDTIVFPILPWVNAGTTIFRNVRFAQVFSAETGGVLSVYTKPKEFEDNLEGVGIALTHLYAIGYEPSQDPHDGRFHRIRVKCLRPGVRIFAREGYYAPSRDTAQQKSAREKREKHPTH